jgi:8-oxo-dGTP diphosphatase
VLVIENGRVLLEKRKGSHGTGTWSAPGGHLEYGESIENCAEREVLEETGLRIRELQHGPFTNTVFEAEQKHYATVFVLAKRESGEVETKEPEKCEGGKWFDWSNLPEPLFPPLEALRHQGFTLPDDS